MLRLVLDTNVVLDLFHWSNTDAVPIMAALEDGQVECLADERTLDELQRVLTYPQLKLTPEMAVDRYRRYSGLVQVFPEGEAPPLVLWAMSEEIRALTLIRCGLDRGRPLEMLLFRLDPDSSRLDLGADRSRSFSPILSTSLNFDFRCFDSRSSSTDCPVSDDAKCRWTMGSLFDCLICAGNLAISSLSRKKKLFPIVHESGQNPRVGVSEIFWVGEQNFSSDL